MEIPNLVRERLGSESIEATVNLGDEDFICVTPTRTILYRGEGLLSDESVEIYDHDVERLDLSTGRRNTKFVLEYVEGSKKFKVPSDRADTLLKILIQGVLRVAGVAGEEESVAGVFQFSELTLIVTDARLVKHVGTPVWDDDFEVFDYADVTGLDFQDGSVATQIILTVNGRPQRIKAPNDQAPRVRQTLTQTLCAHYDVGSLDELVAELDDGKEEADSDASPDASSDIELDDGISPLVGESDERGAGGTTDSPQSAGSNPTVEETGQSTVAETSRENATRRTDDTPATGEKPSPSGTTDTRERHASQSDLTGTAEGIDPDDIEAIEEQLATLTEVVKRQNQLLRKHDEQIEGHDEKIDQLIEELRRGR